MYAIEEIPVSSARVKSKYPIDQLEVGQSFFVPETDASSSTVRATVSSFSAKYKRDFPDKPRQYRVAQAAIEVDGVSIQGSRVGRIL